jgi:hypothetical protein
VLIVAQPDTYTSERRYALEVVLGEFMGLRWEERTESRTDVQITVPELAATSSLTIADGLFATPERLWLEQESLPRTPLARWRLDEAPITPRVVASELPVIFGRELATGSFYEETGDHSHFGLDIFGSIFFQLTRYEEVACPARDEHDRFPASATLAHREGFLTRPLVNEYVELLWAGLERLWPRLQRTRRAFKESVSHDVDWPLHPALSAPRMAKAVIGDLVRARDRGLAVARLRTMRARPRGSPAGDPYNTFDFIMDLSERQGLRSAFYFMAGRSDPRFDGTYNLEDPWIGALMRRIHDRGHELGLHPSYGTFRDAGAICAERAALARACERLGVEQSQWGGRQHFLRWENPTTWRGWEQAGLSYDSSLGFSRDPGFRCGVCFEYPVFDLLARRPMKLRERPLVAMEMAVFDDRLASEQAGLETLERLRHRCRMFDGEFTLLWHNSRLASPRERARYTAALTPPSA